MTEPLLGRSINRLEDERFVQGRGRYIADLAAPNALHGVVVRSTHAHARIAAIRVDAARQMPGVAAVFTGSDLASDNIGPLPCAVTNIPMTTPLVVPPCHALARDIVRYVGEPVAFVVAESAESARDAAEAVVIDYEPLPPVVSIADAVRAGRLVDLAGGREQHRVPIQPRRDRPGRSSDPRRRPCRGMRAGQQPRRRRAAGNPWRARRVRRRERPSAPDRLGRRRARASATCSPIPFFVSPAKNFASAFPMSAAASG